MAGASSGDSRSLDYSSYSPHLKGQQDNSLKGPARWSGSSLAWDLWAKP